MGYLLQKRKTTQIIPRKSIPCQAKEITEVLNSQSWEGKRSFVICGGSSLEGFDFNIIQNELTIGINKSFIRYPTTICYAMDERFYSWVTYPSRTKKESSDLHNYWIKFQGIKVFSRFNDKAKFDPSIYYVNASLKKLISRDLHFGIYAGGNSGFGGMMLAIALGSRQIYMLGLDLNIDRKRKKTHWHNGYEHQDIDNLEKALSRFRAEFEEFADGIKKEGIEVVNCSLNSSLNCFPKKDIREIM